ncbi:MAG TPA: hypothetical protein EYQ11_00770 [Candidatus Poseidoniales archaeon]|nr:hypothetical protein [Candidatus Poseidoniales archaeon]HIL67221.1 hypothetical protein [Candidatus Poseidoniales archaeon]
MANRFVDGMEAEKDTPRVAQFNNLFAPIAITLALLGLTIGASSLDGREVDGDFLSGVILISLSVLIPACIGRTSWLIPLDSGALRVGTLTLAMVILSIIANFVDHVVFNHMFVATFVLVGFVSAVLNESSRFEESASFLSVVLGMRLAAYYAGGLMIAQNDSLVVIDTARESLGSAFFSFWLSSISLGLVVMVGLRGTIEQRGKGRLMSVLPTFRENPEVVAYASLIFASFMVPLIWIGQIDTLQEFSQGSHIGVAWGSFCALVIFIHAFFRAEGWHTLGALLAVNWILYTIGHIHEIGNELPSIFSEDGFIGSFTWFFLWFWMNFFALFFASRGVFGDVAPRRDRSGFRVWWDDNSYVVMVSLAFLIALIVRTAWNVIPAMNANGTGLWDMTGGSDPWYMKRVVDYIIAERSHLIFDHDRAYPSGGINPRPPLFSWSLALGGIALSWVLEIPASQAVWWSMAALPAIYGALIVLPIAGIASRTHSRRAGMIAAWLIALMPGHMSRSTFAMSDHDSFAMLFLAIAFYFWIRAIEKIDHKKLFKTTSPNPLYIIAGMRETWKRNPSLMANATMSGIAFSIMALGWKGFVYGPGILFLAYSFQVAINIFKGRDSIQFTSAALQMMIISILVPAPFYAWPGMNLLFAPSGMQPMFYIIGFTFAMGWISSSFRDKPWLLVVLGGSTLFGSILSLLFILQESGFYNGWDILFTGGFYFSKNKIFGTIGEAQAPERGVLFASYGPVVAMIAIGCAFLLLWRGSRKNKSELTLLGLWTIIATYMAWSAGRFIINATPAMAAVGGIGISMLWGAASLPAFAKVWRNSGIGTPRTRFKSLWPATKARPGVPAMIMVLLLITSQHATYGIDAGIPRGDKSSNEIDQSLYDIVPDILRQDLLGLFSAMNSEQYDPSDPNGKGLWYMGTFGPSFNQQGWNEAYDWLAQQDSDTPFSDRPAFVSWWDYGFQALASGQHPTVADNFQSGIPHSGAMLLSGGQEDTLSLFITTLVMGDKSINGQLGESLISVLEGHMSETQVQEFVAITSNNEKSFLEGRLMAVVAEYGDTELLMGNPLDKDGLTCTVSCLDTYIVLVNGEIFGEPTTNDSEAMSLFDEARGSSSTFELFDFDDASHYDMSGYRYTRDIIDDYDDLSTALHRTNARFGMARAFLITAFSLDDLVQIYDGITSIDSYEVSDYEKSHGSTISRNHEIRYFAVDNRLYPLGGKYYQDYKSYHRGQTTGIFHAPTHLSGLDIDSYITTTYETNQGPKSPEDFQTQYMSDLKAQASGASTGEDMIQMIDMDYQHLDSFFDTMIARTYVGYGTSTLGLPSMSGQVGDADTPSTWILPSSLTGTPGSYLQGAMALPGAMMNHFVLSNWYDPTNGTSCEEIRITGTASTIEGNSQLSNVTLSSLDSLSSGWSQIQSGSSWKMTQVENGTIPMGAYTSTYDADAETLSISSTASSTANVTDFTLTGKADRFCGSIYDSNRNVKILKYFSGATLEGTVSLEGVGPVPNARILIERDAFSGEESADANGNVVDNDSRTYWIPIGSTQADEDGHFSFTVPAGKIRVSAFSGQPDLEAARTALMTGRGNSMSELFTESSQNRDVNPVTGILGNVYGSTWLSETIVNISGSDGHSNGQSVIEAPISVSPSTASGILSWSGELDFDGEPVLSAQVVLTPSSDEVTIQPYVSMTSNGSMVGESLKFTGTGEVTFLGSGTVESMGAVSVYDFTGTHAQAVFDNHSITGEGQFSGKGMIDGTISGDFPNCSGNSVPDGSEACIREIGSFLIDGTVNGSGKFTSHGVSEFTRVLSQATFIGSGIFVTDSSQNLTTFGTVNGTGAFSGNGTFSGPMVRPGSFHIVDALPGEYVVSVDFGVGEPVELPQPFVVTLVSSEYQVPVTISGGAIKGTVSLFSGKPLSNEIAIFSINGSSDDAQNECQGVVTQPCFAIPDESGSFEVGPIVPGSYLAEVDIDDDGFPEISQIFTFESGQALLVAFPSEVPQTSDITFTLDDDGTSVDDLQLQFIPEDLSRTFVSAMFDNATKTYHAELLPGNWILNYTLSDEKQLWQRISIGVVDVSESFEFLVSQVVNGTVVDKPDKEGTISQLSRVTNQEVLFQWEGFTLKSTTDSFGEFSVILPQGVFVQATVERIIGAGGLFSNGTSFQVTDAMEDITIELIDSTMVLGEVSLNREGNTYNQGFSGWQPIFAQANNLDGTTDAVWREEVDDLGRFDMLLPFGNWSFTLDAGDYMGSSSVVKEINSSLDPTIELLVLPLENSTVQIDFFIDHDGDNNASNGTSVSYPFEIKPLSPNGAGYSVSADGAEWIETGMAEISLEPGRYRIVVERANSSADEPFDTLYDTNEIFDVEIEPSTIERSVGFEPRWLVNITFRNESGQILNNHEVMLENAESGWVQTFITNEDGMLVEYINEGDWLVIVEEFETNEGVFEGLRRSVSVSQSSAGSRLNFQTAELATVTVTLQATSDVVTLESIDLTISSQEGLGLFVTSVGGFEQSLEIRLVPGLWNVEINQTNQDGVRMLLENTSLVESGVTVGPDHQIYLTVQMLVSLSGKVFWDLDDDGLPGFSEGLANATVNITNSDLQSHDLITGQDGAWSTFLPAQSSWNITVEKEGFGTQTSQVSIGETSVNEDIEISAGEVEVSGTATYPNQNCISSGGWQIELIPSHGIARDRVSISGNSLGEWSAMIQPGSWVVMATTTSDDSESECNGLVSIEPLEVGVEGGSVESKLTEGGTLMLDTSWLDFEGGAHDLTEIEDYDLVIEYGPISWSEELGSDGILTLLLLPGPVQTSSSFDLDEGVRNVSYSGGKGVSLRAGQVSPLKTLSIDRVSKQSVITTVLGSDRIEVQEVDLTCTNDNDGDGVINGEDAFPNDSTESSDNDGDLIGDNADPDDDNDGVNDWEDDFPLGQGLSTNSVGGCKYQDVEFTISIEYDGHNSFDEYTVVGTVPGADGTDWKVQFQNSTGEWLETATFDMGLTNSDITEELSVRVVPANVGVAHHFSEGHMVLVKMSTSQGYSTQVELRVDVPENNGMEIYEPENLFFNKEETAVTIEIPFKNTGNSDELFYFQFDSSEWWEFAGPTTQPVSPFSDGTATFTLIRSAEPALPSPYAEEITFTVLDQDNNTYSGSTVIETDSPVLSIVGDSAMLIGGSGGFASYGEIEQYSVNISNIGNVDAEGVTLAATLCSDIKCNNAVGVNSTSSGPVSAMSESTFYIAVDYTQFTEANTYWLVFSIDGELLDETSESCTSPKSEGKASCVLEAQLWSSSVENDNLKYLAYAFLIMLIAALLYFTKRPGRRVSAPF